MAEARTLPTPPEVFMRAERMSIIGITLMKKRFHRLLGDDFRGAREDLKKVYGFNSNESKEALLYALELSRIAINEIIDELKLRVIKITDEEAR